MEREFPQYNDNHQLEGVSMIVYLSQIFLLNQKLPQQNSDQTEMYFLTLNSLVIESCFIVLTFLKNKPLHTTLNFKYLPYFFPCCLNCWTLTPSTVKRWMSCLCQLQNTSAGCLTRSRSSGGHNTSVCAPLHWPWVGLRIDVPDLTEIFI